MAKERKRKGLTELVVAEHGLIISDFIGGKKVDVIPVGKPKLLEYRGESIISRAPRGADAYIRGEANEKGFSVQYYKILKARRYLG